MATKSRRTGKGSILKYKVKGGYRWRWQAYVAVNPNDPSLGSKRVTGNGYLTAADADDGLRAALSKAQNLQVVVSKSQMPTVAEFADAWLESQALAPSTLSGYSKILRNHINPNIGNRKLNTVTSMELATLYKKLLVSGRKDGLDYGGALSPNTINKIHIVIGSIFEAALDEGLIASNPARKRRIVKAPTTTQIRASQEEIEVWNATEIAFFLNWDENVYKDELYELWYLIAFTGMRRGEAVALKWGDIDLSNRTISIRRAADPVLARQTKLTKTGKARPVSIPFGVIQVLKRQKDKRRSISPALVQPDAFVFGLPNGDLRSPNDITARWTRAVGKAQAYSKTLPHMADKSLPSLTLKGLRHTHATMLMKNGINPKIVQERLGHSTINTTMNIYSHVTPTMQQDAVDGLTTQIEDELNKMENDNGNS
jgi:integrase